LHQRGVVHGDLYAHNILWNPATGQACLSDFGAATLLPDAGNPLLRSMQALEVRAFGCLLEELVSLVSTGPDHDSVLADLNAMAQACLVLQPSQRPAMAEVSAQLAKNEDQIGR
jgi:hypothetical protein